MSLLNHFMSPKSEFKNGWRIQFKRPLAARAGVLLLCLAAAGSPAQTHTVTSCTEAALRSAMAGGGTVTFACSGTITLANTVVIGTDTTLDGSGQRVTISGSNVVRVFYVNTNATLTLVNLTIANGWSLDCYGGGIHNEGTLNATNCHFVANTIQGPPGLYPGAPYAAGGAVYNTGALNMIDCSFVWNSAGGLSGVGFAPPGMNGGAAEGGAIYNLGGMVIERSLFASNTAVGGAGGNGQNGGNGDSYDWPVPMAGPGGPGGDACGGALFVGGPSSLVNCTLTGNQATGGSGGQGGRGATFYNFENGQVTYFPPGGGGSGGAASGAVCDATGSLRLTNCTIAFNSSVGGPGGLAGNGIPGASGASAGALQSPNGLLANCLLDGNSPTNCNGSIADAGYNLSSDASCVLTNLGSLSNIDPKLGPLADNGGPTLTMALLPGSPAIDAGNTSLAPATDQRGYPRPAWPPTSVRSNTAR